MVLANEEMIVRMFLALVIGALIGLERELRQMPAGLRTHALVCLGSTLFTLASVSITGDNVDITRIAAQVAVGIGFIGGGAIFKADDKIKGLTTAANLWVTSALGLVVGFGLITVAISATLMVLCVLILGKFIEQSTLRQQERLMSKKSSTRFKR